MSFHLAPSSNVCNVPSSARTSDITAHVVADSATGCMVAQGYSERFGLKQIGGAKAAPGNTPFRSRLGQGHVYAHADIAVVASSTTGTFASSTAISRPSVPWSLALTCASTGMLSFC